MHKVQDFLRMFTKVKASTDGQREKLNVFLLSWKVFIERYISSTV